MTTRLTFRGTEADARAIMRRLMSMLTGKEPDVSGIAKGVFLAVGFAALSSIKDDFIVKSRGGVGADGTVWRPLSRRYLAYGRRFERGEQKALKDAAGLGRKHRLAPGDNKGLLSAEQLKRWRKLYAMNLARFIASGMDIRAAKARAAQIAWAVSKREGAKTKLEVFGQRVVDILRDTGVLFNSLSPGTLAGSGPWTTYSKPSGDGGDEQIFEPISNGIIVGTNVLYARRMHEMRPIVPVGDAPEAWREEWAKAAKKAFEVGAALAYQGGLPA